MTRSLEVRRPDVLERLSDWFDTPDLMKFFERPIRRDLIRVEQETVDGKLTIRAEMPGIDPDKDVDITVAGRELTITAQRREEEHRDHAYSEFRYGSFTRTLTMPEGSDADDVVASYADGILTITVPVPSPELTAPRKVAVTRQ